MHGYPYLFVRLRSFINLKVELHQGQQVSILHFICTVYSVGINSQKNNYYTLKLRFVECPSPTYSHLDRTMQHMEVNFKLGPGLFNRLCHFLNRILDKT